MDGRHFSDCFLAAPAAAIVEAELDFGLTAAAAVAADVCIKAAGIVRQLQPVVACCFTLAAAAANVKQYLRKQSSTAADVKQHLQK